MGSAGKTEILWLGLKFHGPQKTVGPSDDLPGDAQLNIVISFSQPGSHWLPAQAAHCSRQLILLH